MYFLHPSIVSCRLPLFLNPTTYRYEVDAEYDPENPPGQKITDAKPLGYSKTMLPHPPNAGNPNPVYQLNNLNQRQIELRVRTFFLIPFTRIFSC